MTTYQIFGATSGPGSQESDTDNYTMGVEFYVTSQAWLTHIRFWASATITGSDHATRCWKVDPNGVVPLTTDPDPFGEETFASPLTSGWNTVALATPVELIPNQRYRACVYFTTNNGYTGTGGYWTSGAGAAGITDGILVAPSAADALANKQCSFNGLTPGNFPPSTFNGGNYWVDVTVNDVEPGSGAVSGVAALPLGALSLVASATAGVPASAAAPLGGLVLAAAALDPTAAALPLGGLLLEVADGLPDTYGDEYTSVVVTHPATAALPLGRLSLAGSTDEPPPARGVMRFVARTGPQMRSVA